MADLTFVIVLVFHIISVLIAVGTVTVTDYLHILGLKNKAMEKKTIVLFPHLSQLIRYALAGTYITGILLVIIKPSFLSSEIFWLKLILVGIVTVNGYIMHHYLLPKIQESIKKNKFTPSLNNQAALTGSISIVSWYAIVVLAITKNTGYSPLEFTLVYIIALAFAYFVALKVETKIHATK